LAYDIWHRGVHIFVTDTTGLNSAQHYFFDWQLKSFWPVSFGNTNHDPYCCHARKNFVADGSDPQSQVMLGCRDGYTRHYLTAFDTDDGTALGVAGLSGSVWGRGLITRYAARRAQPDPLRQ
jgi:hypothetical protein